MKFVKTEELAKGMRLAKPIYNRNGVLLYDRDTKLTRQGINSIKNFGIIGIYILEPAEPLPPMSDDDVEFERFQTMSVFGLKEDLEIMLLGKKPVNIENLVKILVKNYCRRDKKVNFMQNIRSTEDYVYKHSLNVAIMVAMMGTRLKLDSSNIRNAIYAALVHDIGRLMADSSLSGKTSMSEDAKEGILKSENKGLKLLTDSDFISDDIKKILNQKYRLEIEPNRATESSDMLIEAKILQVAETYDDMTAMKIGEDPSSDVVAVRTLLEERTKYDQRIVSALVDSIKILIPGICVELTNGSTGLVIKVNEEDVLRPMVLCFGDNMLYNLSDSTIFRTIQIKDIMKTMDKRIILDKATIDEYLKKYN